MNFKKIITLLLAFTLTLSLAACGSKGDGKGDGDAQGATAEEIYAQIQELADKENAIMEENLELWQKLFAAMNEKRDEIPDESNYGSYLLAALDLVKDQFTEDELKTLTEGSEQIRDLEDQIQPLQEQYAALQPAGDGENGDMSAAVPTFPTFTGKDLDGNDVDSSIFSQNAVTVVNFWFSGCKPCVAELGDLNALNETLKKQGGALIGINVDTLDGNADAISTAKSLLESKGASYQNIYFPSDSAAGDFAGDIMAFPTTYVIDRSGAIVGEAMLGGIDADVVFMDFAMPGLDGAQTTERALAQRPDLKIITLSMFGEESYYSRMVEAGARGFLLKDSDIGDVIEAVETVAAGGSYFSPQLLSSLTGRMRTREDAADEQLSSREREILVAVCRGLSNQEIADELFISKRTVDKHRANILEKTGCKNTANLVVYAIKRGLVEI